MVTRKKRTAKMAVSFAAVELKTSSSKKAAPVKVWILRVWEATPPRGQERLEWFLITNHPVMTFEDAYQVAGWYEKRWVIEEYHKCLKTGMNIESYQFTDTDRLEPAIALGKRKGTQLIVLICWICLGVGHGSTPTNLPC